MLSDTQIFLTFILALIVFTLSIRLGSALYN